MGRADVEGSRVVENVKMRSHVQATRYWVFAVIDALMAHHREGQSRESPSFPTGALSGWMLRCVLSSVEEHGRWLCRELRQDRRGRKGSPELVDGLWHYAGDFD